MANKIKLGTTGKAFRRDVLKDWDITEAHDTERLFQAAHCLDRIEACSAEIEKNGAFYETTSGQKKPNPAILVEKELKSLFCRIIKDLKLVHEDDDPEPTNSQAWARWHKRNG